MKTKLKNGNAIVRLLLAHGEKIGILAFAICTALVIWSALGQDRLEKQPSELKDLASSTQARITSFTWKDLASQETLPDAESPIVKATPLPDPELVKISPDAFPTFKEPFNPPITDPIALRTDPVLFAPEDLEVNADSGLWASANPDMIRRKALEAEKERAKRERDMEDAREKAARDGEKGGGGGRGLYEGGGGEYGGGGAYARGGPGETKTARDAPIWERPRTGAQLQGFEDIQAKSWVTVLAKVPIEQQAQQYIESLRAAKGYNERVDIPTYFAYLVERAEVTSKGQGEWKKIATVDGKSLLKEIQTYPVNVPDVIDPAVKHPILTHPLPPLVLKEFGERASHSSMPLAEEKARLAEEALENPIEEEKADDGKAEKGDELFSAPESLRDRRGAPRGMGGEYGARGRGMGGEYGARGRGMGGEYGGRGGYGGYGGSMGRGSDMELDEFVWDHETPYILFRYFDNTVKPGHSYRYRIRLGMLDVNNKVPVQYLDKSVTERRKEEGEKFFRLTDWSEPSPVASVPLPARIYLVTADPARENNAYDEPEIDVLIKALNPEYAAEVAREETFQRGAVINTTDKAAVIWASKFDPTKSPEFKFQTGITVVDFTGGEKLSSRNKDLIMPARALLMDAAGHLYVQSEMDDLETVSEFQAVLEMGANDRSRGGMGGEYGGGEYGGGEYGGRGR